MNVEKKAKLFLFGIIIVAVVCVVVLLFWNKMEQKSPRTIVGIYQDGKKIRTLDLSLVEDTSSLRVEEKNGGYNILEISKEGVRVKEADCRDGICVKHGPLKSRHDPIVCIPHGLVIQIENKDAKYDSISQ